jgi:hypothetical protein
MYHKYWDGKGWNPTGTEWESLGGSFSGPPAAAMANYVDVQQFHVVGSSKNNLLHKYWDGTAWHPTGKDWETIETKLSDPFTGYAMSSFNGPNPLDVFAVRQAGLNTPLLVYHRYLDGKGVWQQSDWESLGSPAEQTPGFMGVRPAVVAQSVWQRTVYVFAVGQDNKMYRESWNGEAWQPAKTAPWDSLGGTYMGPAAAVSTNDADLVYFAVGTDNEMQQVSDGSIYETGSLGGKFASLPAAFFGGYCDGPPPKLLCNFFVLGLDTDNEVRCIGAMLDGDEFPTTPWKAWQRLGKGESAPAGATTWSGDGSDTTIHIVVLGQADGTGLSVLHKSFSQAPGAIGVWDPSETGWHSLGLPPSGIVVF